MGGTGQATIDGASSIAHNPANLDAIDIVGVTLSATPFILRPKGPFAAPPPDPMTPPTVTQREADLAVVPLFFAGFGVRIHERLVLGAAAQVRTGFGASFNNVPELMGNDLDLTVAVLELQVPLSIRITDEFSVAVSLRFQQMRIENTVFDVMDTPMGPAPVVIEQDMNGFGFVPGATVAFSYQPIPELRLGLTYRSKIKADLEGSTDVQVLGGPTLEFRTETDFATPHVLQFGAAYSALENRLTFAADFAIRFYDDANNTLVTTDRATNAPLMGARPVVLEWDNVYEGRFGVEFKAIENLSLRVGYGISNSATPDATAQVLTPTPGLFHFVGGGLGLHFGDLDINLAAGSIINRETVSPNPPSAPGRYETRTALVALSVSYHHGRTQ